MINFKIKRPRVYFYLSNWINQGWSINVHSGIDLGDLNLFISLNEYVFVQLDYTHTVEIKRVNNRWIFSLRITMIENVQ